MFCDGCKNISLFLFTGFVAIFGTKLIAAKFERSLPSVKRSLSWHVQSKMAPSRKTLEALKEKMEQRKKGSFASIFAIPDPSLLREVGMEQLCRILRASSALQTYAAIGVCVHT